MHHESNDEPREPHDSEAAGGDEPATYDLAPTARPESDVDTGPQPGTDSESSDQVSKGDVVAEDRLCQACGAPMPEDDAVLVCPSCGYDMVTNRIIDPTSSEVGGATDDLDDDVEPLPPLVASPTWKPFAVTAAALLGILAFAMIAGWSSFFRIVDGRFLDGSGQAVLDAPAVSHRFAAVLKLFVGSGVLLGCGLVAARVTAWAHERPFGDVRGAAGRLALVVAIAAATRLIPIDSSMLQNIVHGVLGVGAMVGMTMLLVGDRGRVAGLLLVSWGVAVLLVVPLARLIAWALPLF